MLSQEHVYPLWSGETSGALKRLLVRGDIRPFSALRLLEERLAKVGHDARFVSEVVGHKRAQAAHLDSRRRVREIGVHVALELMEQHAKLCARDLSQMWKIN